MLGTSHLVANTCALATISTATYALENQYDLFFKSEVREVAGHFHKFMLHSGPKAVPFGIWLALCLFLFYLGTLLPDIDHEHSTLGRFFYIPVEHRTWTHAIWIPFVFAVASLWVPVLAWLAAGYFLHLFFDNFSAGGVCFFYPVTSYRKYGPDGVKVKKAHILKLYYTGKTSEFVRCFHCNCHYCRVTGNRDFSPA